MYYSAGNYAAFARPEKPEGVERKSAYILGSGLAGLSAAFYLLRDGQMKGEHIHVLERQERPGGSLGAETGVRGFFMRGGQGLDEHFEILWDIFRDVPSLENPEISVLDECCRLNRHGKTASLCRATLRRGEDAHTDGKFTLDSASALALLRLFFTPEEALEDRKISELMPESFWETNFWLYWQTNFAFQRWSGALEMKRRLCRCVHMMQGLPDGSSLRFTKRNPYESLVLPLVRYLEARGVKFEYGMEVQNVRFDAEDGRRTARQLVCVRNGVRQTIDLIEDDLVFITNGSSSDANCCGDQTHAPELRGEEHGCGAGWELWKAIAAQAEDGAFGRPEAFCGDVEATGWMSATVASANGEILRRVMEICQRDPRLGGAATGGMVTAKDSADGWYLSWEVGPQPQLRTQGRDTVLIWLYGLNPDKAGNFVKKAMRQCTGEEVCREWLYQIGVPEERIDVLAADACNTTTCFMPYAGAALQPRKRTDRPPVVPAGAVNFAFIGQFSETPRDAAGTIEYAVRTGMEAACTLLNIDRAIPEVWGSGCDLRWLLRAVACVLDKRPLEMSGLRAQEQTALRLALQKIRGTDLEALLEESGLSIETNPAEPEKEYMER